MIDRLQEGLDFFNRGSYFEAHESWEDLWRETEGEARAFYQGLVQAAVGMHHLFQGNQGGGERVLRRGVEKLEAYPDRYAGLDNARLTGQLRRILECRRPERIRIRRAGG